MRKRVLGKTGLVVSELGFGGAPIGYLHTEPSRVARMLNSLLDAGVTVIDTAVAYEQSQESIQYAIGHRRSEYLLISKCGKAFASKDAPRWSSALVQRSIELSLSTLKTDHIDVMLLHTCPIDVLRDGEALEALIRARDDGKIRFAGYSGDNDAAILASSIPDISVIETSLNICDQSSIHTTIPSAKRHGGGVIAKRSLANAAWKPLSEQLGRYRNDYARVYSERLQRIMALPEAAWMCALSRTEWAELSIRFAVTHSDVHTFLIGTTDPVHAGANIEAVAKGPLPPDVYEAIRSLYSSAESGERWSGQE